MSTIFWNLMLCTTIMPIHTALSRYPSAQAVLAALSMAASSFHPHHTAYSPQAYSSAVSKGHIHLLLLFISGFLSKPVYNHVFNICLVQLAASFLFGLFFYPEDGSNTFSYQAIHHHIPKDRIPYSGAC
jgi:hypothetical protein